ncbi:MAG TPA: FAD-binding oxidoreductase [Spirochaetota bacterium]|nr:FAD-binding oxidoreductase [Spirochaetota bacterium]
MTSKKRFEPSWRETPPAFKSYRSIFKWGAPDGYKHPNHKLFEEIKSSFGLNDSDFSRPISEGDEPVSLKTAPKLAKKTLVDLAKICGSENVSIDSYQRVKYSSGKTVEEAINLRQGKTDRVTDAVVHPRNKKDVQDIINYCNRNKIPVYVYGGGSSVNMGLRPSKGGITLVMNTHMNKIIQLNETDQTVTVQAGIMGPALEASLNNAQNEYKTRYNFTCGHFPQSFEYSSAGGWVVTLGSGQCSSYYGDAYDLVISQEYITPSGSFKTPDYPGTATGPKVNDIMKGNEGTFGVLVEVTFKVFRFTPENRQRFGFIFPTFKDAINAGREISQSEFGMPAVFRISDEEETHIGLKLYGIDGTILDRLIQLRGFKPMQRCLFLGSSEGEIHFAKNVKRQVKKICRKHGGMYISGLPTKMWEPGRYKDPYLREDLQDYGFLIDTLETGVTWSRLHTVHQEVRRFIKARRDTICMTHSSHFYSQGTNLYFIFIMKDRGVEDYVKFQEGVIEAIYASGGSLSHHHGVGKMISPWMEKHLGKEQMSVLRTLKKHFDPKNIMNPGGQLGLDAASNKWRSIK